MGEDIFGLLNDEFDFDMNQQVVFSVISYDNVDDLHEIDFNSSKVKGFHFFHCLQGAFSIKSMTLEKGDEEKEIKCNTGDAVIFKRYDQSNPLKNLSINTEENFQITCCGDDRYRHVIIHAVVNY